MSFSFLVAIVTLTEDHGLNFILNANLAIETATIKVIKKANLPGLTTISTEYSSNGLFLGLFERSYRSRTREPE